LNRDTILNAIYKVEHHVVVSSKVGKISGEGWYAEGSIATVSVTPSVVPENFLINRVFDGWFENSTKVSSSTTYSFVVTRPVHLVASWRTELNFVALCILVLIIVLVLAVVLVLLTRRKPPTLPPPPPDRA